MSAITQQDFLNYLEQPIQPVSLDEEERELHVSASVAAPYAALQDFPVYRPYISYNNWIERPEIRPRSFTPPFQPPDSWLTNYAKLHDVLKRVTDQLRNTDPDTLQALFGSGVTFQVDSDGDYRLSVGFAGEDGRTQFREVWL